MAASRLIFYDDGTANLAQTTHFDQLTRPSSVSLDDFYDIAGTTETIQKHGYERVRLVSMHQL